MNWTSLHILLALPEIVLLSAVSLILLVDLFLKDEQRGITFGLSLLALLLTAVATWYGYGLHQGGAFCSPTQPTLCMYVADAMGSISKIAICGLVAGVLLYSRRHMQDRGLFKGEFLTLMLFATLGMLVMVSASHFLTLYVGLELMSLSLYSLVAMNRDHATSTEAAMKYFVLGALASGMLLYGISMIYGATQSLYLSDVYLAASSGHGNSMLMIFGLVFVVSGIAFKLGAVPFHMWVADVYEGAPTSMTLFIASAPKLAAFVFAYRILEQGLHPLSPQWRDMLIATAVASLVLGNLTAIVQTNIKRMLAYSTISHMGFLILGLLAGTSEGYAAALYYAIVYGLMSLASFGLLLLLSREGVEVERLEQLKGLGKSQPLIAGLMLLTMFSMAGIPPLVGFFAKLAVLSAVINVGTGELTWVAVVAVVCSLIGAFYYLRVVKLMWFDETEAAPLPRVTLQGSLLLAVNGALLLGLGLLPQSLLGVISEAFRTGISH